MNQQEWLEYGYKQGFVSPPVCYTHDGLPTTEAEDVEFEETDPCINILRVYEDADQKKAVEANHEPSVWRATNQGWTATPTTPEQCYPGATDERDPRPCTRDQGVCIGSNLCEVCCGCEGACGKVKNND